jgi:hypothetical protein
MMVPGDMVNLTHAPDQPSDELVAEDNVCLLKHCSGDVSTNLCKLRDIGRYFTNFDDATSTFSPNAKVAAEYPDL